MLLLSGPRQVDIRISNGIVVNMIDELVAGTGEVLTTLIRCKNINLVPLIHLVV